MVDSEGRVRGGRSARCRRAPRIHRGDRARSRRRARPARRRHAIVCEGRARICRRRRPRCFDDPQQYLRARVAAALGAHADVSRGRSRRVVLARRGADEDRRGPAAAARCLEPTFSAISTRRFRLPSLLIFSTRMAPISPMFATWVPPQGCRSMPGMRSRRTRPAPRGGCTLIVFTSSGRASSSSSVIQTVSVAMSRAISAFVSRSITAASSRLMSMSKSSRALSGAMLPPVTGATTTQDSTCRAVCRRISA